MQWTFNSIGQIHTACKEKFGLPRQSGLVPELSAEIEIFSPYDRDEAFAELEQFSHIWVLSIFHQSIREDWQPTVRPPRLGGNAKVGVFASRAPYRPNPIGLSVFELKKIKRMENKLLLQVAGNDLVDGTPVVDIKPYVPYADCLEHANGGYTDTVVRHNLDVSFSEQARTDCQAMAARGHAELESLIMALLKQDPRPAYQMGKSQADYGFQLYDMNVRFTIVDEKVIVTGIDIFGNSR